MSQPYRVSFVGEPELIYYVEFVVFFEDGLRLDAGGLALGLLFLDIVGKIAESLGSTMLDMCRAVMVMGAQCRNVAYRFALAPILERLLLYPPRHYVGRFQIRKGRNAGQMCLFF